MERLTKHWGNNYVATKLDYCSLLEIPDEDFKCFEAIVKKLAEYEDLEEQGRLIVLPCRDGDTVYKIDSYYICDYEENYECDCPEYHKCEDEYEEPCEYQYKRYCVAETRFRKEMLAVIGKTIFLTKAEAEKALAEMEK